MPDGRFSRTLKKSISKILQAALKQAAASLTLSIRVLPKEDKAEVRKLFGEFANWLEVNYRQDAEFWKTNPYGWRRWQAVLGFMDAEDHTDQLPAFGEYITNMDEIRGTSFSETFPELKHLL